MDQQSVATGPRSVVGDQLRAVRRRWQLIALVAVVAVTASLAYSLLRVPEYRSTAEVLLSATAYDVQRGTTDLTPEEIATQVEVATSQPVAALVRDDLRLAATPSLDDLVTVEALGSSRVLRFTARTSHPEEAAEIARSVATAYLTHRQTNTQQTLAEINGALTDRQDQLESALDSLDDSALTPERRDLESQLGQITTQLANLDIAVTGGAGGQLLNEPEETTSQVAPNPLLNGVLSLFIGLLAGLALALTRDRFDGVAHDEASLVPYLEPVPVLGRIPGWKAAAPEDWLVTVTRPVSRSSQAFQELVARIRFLVVGIPETTGRGAVLMCTSAEADEGKTDLAVNLAVAAARVGMRVIFVDADLRRGSVRLLGLPDADAGLSDVLTGRRRAEHLLLEGPVPGLSVLPAGNVPNDPGGLIASTRMRPVLAGLAEHADLVVVDTSPNARFADALEVAVVADATLLVTRLGRSRRSSVRAAAERLHDVGAANLGVVVMGGRAGRERFKSSAASRPGTATTTTVPAPADSAPAELGQGLGDHPVRDRAEKDLPVRQSPRG